MSEKESDLMDIAIHKVRDHYEIYIQGKFYCSADNMQEVAEEMERVSNQQAS